MRKYWNNFKEIFHLLTCGGGLLCNIKKFRDHFTRSQKKFWINFLKIEILQNLSDGSRKYIFFLSPRIKIFFVKFFKFSPLFSKKSNRPSTFFATYPRDFTSYLLNSDIFRPEFFTFFRATLALSHFVFKKFQLPTDAILRKGIDF